MKVEVEVKDWGLRWPACEWRLVEKVSGRWWGPGFGSDTWFSVRRSYISLHSRPSIRAQGTNRTVNRASHRWSQPGCRQTLKSQLWRILSTVGLHWNSELGRKNNNRKHRVSFAYCKFPILPRVHSYSHPHPHIVISSPPSKNQQKVANIQP